MVPTRIRYKKIENQYLTDWFPAGIYLVCGVIQAFPDGTFIYGLKYKGIAFAGFAGSTKSLVVGKRKVRKLLIDKGVVLLDEVRNGQKILQQNEQTNEG